MNVVSPVGNTNVSNDIEAGVRTSRGCMNVVSPVGNTNVSNDIETRS